MGKKARLCVVRAFHLRILMLDGHHIGRRGFFLPSKTGVHLFSKVRPDGQSGLLQDAFGIVMDITASGRPAVICQVFRCTRTLILPLEKGLGIVQLRFRCSTSISAALTIQPAPLLRQSGRPSIITRCRKGMQRSGIFSQWRETGESRNSPMCNLYITSFDFGKSCGFEFICSTVFCNQYWIMPANQVPSQFRMPITAHLGGCKKPLQMLFPFTVGICPSSIAVPKRQTFT